MILNAAKAGILDASAIAGTVGHVLLRRWLPQPAQTIHSYSRELNECMVQITLHYGILLNVSD